jgi:hypothetical protein
MRNGIRRLSRKPVSLARLSTPVARELSLREIAVRLASEGYVTPSGSTYSASAIKSMLSA